MVQQGFRRKQCDTYMHALVDPSASSQPPIQIPFHFKNRKGPEQNQSKRGRGVPKSFSLFLPCLWQPGSLTGGHLPRPFFSQKDNFDSRGVYERLGVIPLNVGSIRTTRVKRSSDKRLHRVERSKTEKNGVF